MFVRNIRSTSTSHFTTAIVAQGTASNYETENIAGLTSNKIFITGLAFKTTQALPYDIAFYRTDDFSSSAVDSDDLCGQIKFAQSNTLKVSLGKDCAYSTNPASKTKYFATWTGRIPYVDEDETNKLHIALINRSGTPKTADAGGGVNVDVYYEEQIGY